MKDASNFIGTYIAICTAYRTIFELKDNVQSDSIPLGTKSTRQVLVNGVHDTGYSFPWIGATIKVHLD